MPLVNFDKVVYLIAHRPVNFLVDNLIKQWYSVRIGVNDYPHHTGVINLLDAILQETELSLEYF